MPTTVSLPQLGESVDSGTIVSWLVDVGDDVSIDQPLVEVSTDKVDTEVPSPVAGRVTAILADPDQVVAVGDPLLELDGDETGPVPVAEPAAEPATPSPAPPRAPLAAPTAASGSQPTIATTRAPSSAPGAAGPRRSPLVKRLLRDTGLAVDAVTATGPQGRITPDDVRSAAARAQPRLSPLVKRLLAEHELVASGVSGSGPDGRITPDDVRAAVSDRGAATGDDRADASSPPAPGRSQPADERSPAPHRDGDRVESLTRMRSIVAQRMLESLQTTAQLTAAVEADVTRLMHVRARAAAAYRARYGSGLSPLAFITRSLCRTLVRHPLLNASIDTDASEVTYHRAVNLGIAVDTPQGLMVPNIVDAEHLNVAGLQQRIADLARRARDRGLTPDEVRGGTFTVTNTGSRGSLFDTPILNPPEVGILATPTIEKRPVVVTDADGSDRVAIRQRTYLCLTYDHRLVDGADAARFLTDLAADLDGDGWEQELAEFL
jgi:pyruvate dehydrogenase E2 component (dihydrolipoamide acetyltransferase)